MFGKDRMNRGISKVLAIALLAGGMFLSQSCNAGFWGEIKDAIYCIEVLVIGGGPGLINKTCSLNEKLDRLNSCTREEREVYRKFCETPSNKKDPHSLERLRLHSSEQLTDSSRDAVEKELDDYFDYIAKNPNEVLEVKPYVLPSTESHGCRGILARHVSNKFKDGLKKCMASSNSMKTCKEAFLLIGNPLFGGNFAKDLLQKMEKEMREEKQDNF